LPFFRRIAEGQRVNRGEGFPDWRSGLIMVDFMAEAFPGHEARGGGKTDPPGGQIIVNRKN
jgi:hypothetical protein